MNPKMQLQKATNRTEQGGMGANRCSSATSLTQGGPPGTAQQKTTRRVIRVIPLDLNLSLSL